MSLKGMEGLEGCSQWNSMRDQTRSDGGRAEPPGGGEAVWRLPEHDQEDASVVGSAGLSAAGAAGIEEARSVHGVDRQGPGR